MNQRHKHADVIIAWAKGAEVDSKVAATGEWVRARHPGWHEDCEYRVKPPARKYRVALFQNSNNGYYYTVVADTQDDAVCYVDDSGFVRWLTDWVEYEV